jgi:spermidine synthase
VIRWLSLALVIACAPVRASRLSPPAAAAQRDAGRHIVYSQASPFGTVLVIDEGDYRYLRFDTPDGDDQSMISLSDARAVPMRYIRHAAVGWAATGKLERVLMVGLGGGTYTTLLRQVWPDVEIDVVEINRVVVEVAERFFRVRQKPGLRIHIGDGRRFLEQRDRRYDLIFVDAYSGEGIPAHLRATEFFRLAGTRLRDGGVLVVNLSVSKELETRLVGRLQQAFAGIVCLRTPDTLNLVVLAKAQSLIHERLVKGAVLLDRELSLPFSLAELAARSDMGCERALFRQTPR